LTEPPGPGGQWPEPNEFSVNERQGLTDSGGISRPNVGRALTQVLIEAAFATLPVIMLGGISLSLGGPEAHRFWHGPELPTTSCVLFGLTLARLLPGAIIAARTFNGDVRTYALRFVVIAMIPLTGIIISSVVIAQIAIANIQLYLIWTMFIFFSSVISFIVLGGYGLSRAE
jgi:hypothetical protein